jgi:hypothetical protein
MKKKTHYLRLLLVASILFSYCQNDNDLEPKEVIPKTYAYKIQNQLNFNFEQQSKSVFEDTPFTNKVSINSLSSSLGSSSIVIYAFEKDDTLTFSNLSFIKNQVIDFSAVTDTVSVSLEKNNNLFSENNTLVQALNLFDEKHEFSGFYEGEYNIYKIDSTLNDNRKFIKSLQCFGSVDYKGRFFLFTENDSETEISLLKGSFNSNNLVTASIINNVNIKFSDIKNDSLRPIKFESKKLKGELIYTTNNDEEHQLELNLTQQN